MAADSKNYKASIHGYILAIKKAEENAESADVILNLKLCLAETFCQAGQLDDCQKLLDSVKEKIFDAVSAKDLSIQVRFWRRMTNLELARKDSKAAIIASSNGIKVLSAISPDHNSNRYLSSWYEHIYLLSKQNDLQPMLNDLEDFAKNNTALVKRKTKLRQRFMDSCYLWFEKATTNASTISYSPTIVAAAKYTDDEQSLELWKLYLQYCSTKKLCVDKTALLTFFDAYKKVPDVAANSPLRIQTCEVLRQYLETAKDLTENDKIKYFGMLYDTFKDDKDCTPEQLNIKLCACAGLLSAYCRSGASAAQRAPFMKVFEKLCSEIPKTEGKTYWAKYYTASQFWLFQFYAHDQRLDKMESTLAQFNPSVLDPKSTLAERDFFTAYIARQHAYLALLFSRAGDKERAGSHAQEAKRLLPLISAKEKATVSSLLADYATQSSPKRESNKLSTNTKSK
ncbi:MAG: hypothetical protein K2X81_06615 [Candidatus Obscuribacterales bacterium]|nr:hypothetical protein [Candidatus Obscuribacterales bacterium]